MTETIDAQGHASYSFYDQDGNVTETIDRDGRKRDMVYDGDGHLLSETWYAAGGTLTDTRSYTYDGDGNQLTASNAAGTYTFTYDNAGRVQTQTDPWGMTLSYGYDADGNRTLVQDSLGGITQSTYNADGQLTRRLFSGAGQSPLRIDLTYTADGQIQTETRYSDLAGTQLVGSCTYQYDPVDRVQSIIYTDASGNVIASYSYGYDADGNVQTETDNGQPISYGYDATNQVTSAGGCRRATPRRRRCRREIPQATTTPATMNQGVYTVPSLMVRGSSNG